ncbi:MAG: ATP-binding cassette domain-containing protein [Chloroflexi bacterium]|nr:ATP-binding cassette domain-containing protein [Chloroflexota bacterium]
MFALEGVSKVYGGLVALAPLSLTIAPGERVALMGPSGSGKTTLLNLLAAVIRPDTGRLSLAGQPGEALRPGRDLARLVGIMPQSFDLVPSLAVAHNVLAGRLGEWGFFRSLLSLVVPQELERARGALARVGIPEKLHERTSHLSGGEQQRVALARLLVQRPRAILADEPVAALDPARAEDLVAMLSRITQEEGQTLVASLHSVPLALRYFSRIIALRRGRLVFDLPADAVTEEEMARLYALEDGGPS